MQALYLESRNGVKLRRDGPALEVRVPDKAARLIPLKRLNRIVLHKSAEISLEDLVDCMAAGVVFSFADKRGKVHAWGLASSNALPLSVAWDRFCQRIDHEERLHLWLRQRTVNAVHAAAVTLGQPNHNEAEWLAGVIHHWTVRFVGEQSAADTLLWLETEISGQLTEALQVLGLSAPALPAIAHSLTSIIRWRLEPLRIKWLQSIHARNSNHNSSRTPEKQDFILFLQEIQQQLNAENDDLVKQFSAWVVTQTVAER